MKFLRRFADIRQYSSLVSKLRKKRIALFKSLIKSLPWSYNWDIIAKETEKVYKSLI